MTCSEVERVLPEVIDGAEDDAEFQAHLKICPGCSELVAELKLIASEARELAEIEEPPARVWVGISNQLRAEGIIRDPEAAAARPVLVPPPARRWNAWWLAPVAVAILAAGSYQLAHHQTATSRQQAAQQPAPQRQTSQPQVAQSTPAPPAPQPPASQPSPASTPSDHVAHNQARRPIQKSTANEVLQAEVSPPPSEDDQRFLSEVSQRAPSARATYERQLQAVNAEIRETQDYIKLNPGDLDARQHLMEVYQQKAMLYQMALDRIQ